MMDKALVLVGILKVANIVCIGNICAGVFTAFCDIVTIQDQH